MLPQQLRVNLYGDKMNTILPNVETDVFWLMKSADFNEIHSDRYLNMPIVCYLAKAGSTGCTPANGVLGW